MPAAQAPTQGPAQPKPEDVLKNLVLVEKPQEAPDKIKVGFSSITAKDSIAMLGYLASDLMEGRETATRGFQQAAEFAATQFALWNLKPGGDRPRPVPPSGMMGMMGGQERRQPPSERSFLQEFAMVETRDSATEVNLEIRTGALGKKRPFQSGVDFTGGLSAAGALDAPVVFAGYGISEKQVNYDDFKDLDVKGKIVLVLSEAPGKDNPESPFQKDKALKEKYFPPAGTPRFGRGGGGFNKAQEMAKLGAVAVLMAPNSTTESQTVNAMASSRRTSDERPIINRTRRRLTVPGVRSLGPAESVPVINITHGMADAILEAGGEKLADLKRKIESTNKPASSDLPGTRLSIVTSAASALVGCRNVVGYVEGSDPKLKDEVVVVGAHLDHYGKYEEYVFNGADDNGSGSVGVLNVARAFALSPEKPKRSVVFCLWTGEEQGLLGSRYYVLNPAFPIEKTAAYINLDMISRPYDERSLARISRMMNLPASDELLKRIKPANFLPVSFSAGTGLAEALRSANQHVGLDVYLRESGENRDRGMGGSDHSSFAAAKVPWVFCITSMHEDFHQTGDSVDKVSGEMIEKISRLVYVAAFLLADK
jgi:hypothetical protein